MISERTGIPIDVIRGKVPASDHNCSLESLVGSTFKGTFILDRKYGREGEIVEVRLGPHTRCRLRDGHGDRIIDCWWGMENGRILIDLGNCQYLGETNDGKTMLLAQMDPNAHPSADIGDPRNCIALAKLTRQ